MELAHKSLSFEASKQDSAQQLNSRERVSEKAYYIVICAREKTRVGQSEHTTIEGATKLRPGLSPKIAYKSTDHIEL